MERLARLRQWINRDDGRLFRIGNADVGVLEVVVVLGVIAILVFLQLRHLGLLGAGSSAAATTVHLSPSDLVGTWRCGPTVMQAPGFTVTVTDETTKRLDGTYTGHAITVISAPGKPALTLRDRSNGRWELVGDVVRTRVGRVEFLSASDPAVTEEAGQKAQDAQLAKKSVYESRILEFTGTHSRSIPVDPMYKEAAVESACARI